MRIVTAMLAMAAAACAQQPTEPVATRPAQPIKAARALLTLVAPGFEADFPPARNCPLQWICRVHVDPKSFRFTSDESERAEGLRSLRIEKVGPEPWATVLQSLPAREAVGRRVRFSISVRLAGVDGRGAGPWILARGPNGVIEHREVLATGTGGWRRVPVEMDIPAQTESIEVGAMLEGEGRLWVDDARIEILPPAGGNGSRSTRE